MSFRVENNVEVRTPVGQPAWTWSNGTNTCGFYYANGTPESNIIANVGSLAMDYANKVLYRKDSGSLNTGWEPVNTNFLNTDLSSTGSRTHLLNNNFFSIKGNTTFSNGSQINVNGSLIYLQGGTEYLTGNITLDTGGIDLQMIGATDLRLNDDPGTAGQVIKSAGPNLPAVWGDEAAAANLTTGTMAAASNPRVADFGNNNLTFNNIDQLAFNGGGLSVFTFTTPILALDHPGTGSGGRLALLDDDANRSVSWQAPGTVNNTYTMTLPNDPPSANGQVMTFQTDGTAAFSTISAQSRKYDADNLGNISIAAPFNFDAGSYDNKIVNVTGNVNVITLSSTRSGYYSIRFASAGGPYNLAWGSVTFFGSTPPSSIDTEEFLVELFYDSISDVWHYLEGSNFFSKDFTATENRFHHLANNGLFMRGGTSTLDGSLFTMNGELLYMLGGISGSNSGSITLDANGVKLDFGGSGDLKLASDPGTNGQVLTSNGPDVPPSWEDAGGSSPNITTGSLSNADGPRSVPMNSENLTFTGMADLTMIGTTGSTFTFQADDFIIDSPVSATPGRVTFQDGDNSHNVKLGAAATTTASYTITLPPAAPASNGQLLSFTTAGVASFIDAPSGDHLFTQPLQNTYGDISHDANTHDFGITNIGTLDFQAVQFGIGVDQGAAFAIDSQGTVTWGKYAAGAQDGTPSRALGIDASGTMVSFEHTPSQLVLGRIRLDAELLAGTELNLVTAADGTAFNHTIVPDGVGTPSLAGHPTQAAFAADPNVQIYWEGTRVDKTGYGRLNVTRLSNTSVSFSIDLPEDSILEFEFKT